jgi:hypothetical protein
MDLIEEILKYKNIYQLNKYRILCKSINKTIDYLLTSKLTLSNAIKTWKNKTVFPKIKKPKQNKKINIFKSKCKIRNEILIF